MTTHFYSVCQAVFVGGGGAVVQGLLKINFGSNLGWGTTAPFAPLWICHVQH